MIETENLQRLDALAGAIHGKGTTVEMLNRWAAFEAACKPELIQAMVAEIGRLKAENEALRKNADRYLWLREHHWLCEKDVDSKIAAWNAPKGVQP
ncbi:hypothetical protein RK21_02319 [Pseudomonas plecoglossicida]|uniref:hypothetical protein n=1 Tax=Pseudomonas plecoglossicida TaxID=70775 RepID=UPI00059F06EA|nr:hypothetical protein [Pseudomonas plecoglossicida]AJG13827.1 hypothetical protein RK21_02319 [Pseudomonas plecoglossicida]